MFHPVLPSGVQSVYGISWWQLPGTYSTIDEPGLGYIPKSSSNQYVSDVFYKVGTKPELHCNKI